MTPTPLRGRPEAEARATFKRVFPPGRRPPRSFQVWFRPDVDVRILYPQNYVLDDETFTPFRDLLRAADKSDDYFIRLCEAPSGAPLYWVSRWDDGPPEDLQEDVPLLENVWFPASAQWGLFLTEANFALLGAPTLLLEALESSLPNSFDEQEHELIDDALELFGPGGPKYLLPLMSALKGEDEARELLRRAGFIVAL
jgi:hypothetical protein